MENLKYLWMSKSMSKNMELKWKQIIVILNQKGWGVIANLAAIGRFISPLDQWEACSNVAADNDRANVMNRKTACHSVTWIIFVKTFFIILLVF